MGRAHHRSQARAVAPQKLRLAAGAVIERRVGQHDEADAERAEPGEVDPVAKGVVGVEELVLRKVVLPEPAASQRHARPRQVDGVPVPGGIYRLDAVGEAQVPVEVRNRRLPVRRLGGLVVLARHEAEGERCDVPRDREQERRQHER